MLKSQESVYWFMDVINSYVVVETKIALLLETNLLISALYAEKVSTTQKQNCD